METLLLDRPKASLDGFHRWIANSRWDTSIPSNYEERVRAYSAYLSEILGSDHVSNEFSHWGRWSHWVECHWGNDAILEKKRSSNGLSVWLKKKYPDVYKEYAATK